MDQKFRRNRSILHCFWDISNFKFYKFAKQFSVLANNLITFKVCNLLQNTGHKDIVKVYVIAEDIVLQGLKNWETFTFIVFPLISIEAIGILT